MPFPFGQQITYTFYPLVGEESINLSTDNPAIYIYSAYPTRTNARTGGGSPVESITSWSNTTDGKGKKITITAIDDPDPNSSQDEYTYYIAINFYLESSEQLQTVIQALPMQRVVMHHKKVDVDIDDIKDVNTRIDANFTDDEIRKAISAAQELNVRELDNLGFEWATLWRPDKLKEAIVYKTLYFLCKGNQAATDDVWADMARAYQEVFNNIFTGLKIQYKNSEYDEGKITETEPAFKTLRIRR